MSNKEIAIILAGCGTYDGSDIHETAAATVAVQKAGYKPVFYSFDKDQSEVVDHLVPIPTRNCSGDPGAPACCRNMLVESGRIARGMPAIIQDLDVDSVSGILVPGGNGILKNLTNTIQFATKEAEEPQVDEDLHTVVKGIHASGKPIGVVGQAALIPAIVLRNEETRLSFGTEDDQTELFVQLAKGLGVQIEEVSAEDCCVDSTNNIISTPGLISESSTYLQVHHGIGRMVEEMVKLIEGNP